VTFDPVPLTFLALQSHSGLQVVHLHLQALQGEVVLVGLPPVGQQDDGHDDEEQPPSGCDAEDGGKGEQAVGLDENLSWRDVESSYLDLQSSNNNSNGAIFKIGLKIASNNEDNP